MKEELTTAMHSEFKVSEETDIKHRAMNVWYYGMYKTEEEIKEACKTYGLTYEQALEWKDYFLTARELRVLEQKRG